MPRTSRWVAKHRECQVAVDNVAAKYQAEIERLSMKLKIATDALEYIGNRGYTGAATVAHEALTQLSALE